MKAEGACVLLVGPLSALLTTPLEQLVHPSHPHSGPSYCRFFLMCPTVGRLSGPELMPKCDLPIMQLNAASAAQRLQGSLCTA